MRSSIRRSYRGSASLCPSPSPGFSLGRLWRFLFVGVLALSPLATGLGWADDITYDFNGNLIGSQSLPQFNPSNGTLTAVTFNLTSDITGTIPGSGILLVMPFQAPTCLLGAPVPEVYTAQITSSSSDLATNIPGMVPPNLGCTSESFDMPVNIGPAPGAFPLTFYTGTGTLPFTFSLSSPQGFAWSGTLGVDYAFTPPASSTPEPSMTLLWITGLGSLVSLKTLARK